MIKILIVVGVIGVVLVGLYLLGTAEDRKVSREYKSKHKVTPDERKELLAYEELVEELRTLALDHMDVEPFARIVFDTIRTKEKGFKK